MRSWTNAIIALVAFASLLCSIPAPAQGRWTTSHAKGVYDSAQAACDAELKSIAKSGGPSLTLSEIAPVPATTYNIATAICGFMLHYPGGYSQPYPMPVYNWCSGAFKQSGYCAPGRPSRIVTVTITGTVASGRDNVGIFGRSGADLAGKPFTVIYTLDDKKGAQQLPDCGNAPFCYSEINSLGAESPLDTSSPGTAVVQIDGRAAPTIGTATDGSAGTELRKTIYGCCNYPMTYQMAFDVHDAHGYVRAGVRNTTSGPPATTNPDWRSAFSDARLFRVISPADSPGGESFSFVKDRTVQAHGRFIEETICVSDQPNGCASSAQR
jgi:hypothetical protein